MTQRLTYSQRRLLRLLAAAGETGLRRSCTNATLCALERRDLARWDSANSGGYVTWWLTSAGKDALNEKQ
jgi:hypothetical protein